MRELTEQQMERRVVLYQAWMTGYTGGKKLHADNKLVEAFFCVFIADRHPDLALSQAEKDMTACFDKMLPDDLQAEIEKRLPNTSRETGVKVDILRAVVHGAAVYDAAYNKGKKDAASLLRDASLSILQFFKAEDERVVGEVRRT
jgi:hypothetical protein